MSYSRQDPNLRATPAVDARRAVPSAAPPGGVSIAPELLRVLERSGVLADDLRDLLDVVEQFLRTAVADAERQPEPPPVFEPTPALLELLDLPDVTLDPTGLTGLTGLSEALPRLALLREAEPTDTHVVFVAALALAATFPTAAQAVQSATDPRPEIAALIAAALRQPRVARSQKEVYQRTRSARDALTDELTTFGATVFDAGSANDSEMSAAAVRVLLRLYVFRRWLLEVSWAETWSCWKTLDRVVKATYWPPDAVTITRMDTRLRGFAMRRWPLL
jgi:hypothetical protein